MIHLKTYEELNCNESFVKDKLYSFINKNVSKVVNKFDKIESKIEDKIKTIDLGIIKNSTIEVLEELILNLDKSLSKKETLEIIKKYSTVAVIGSLIGMVWNIIDFELLEISAWLKFGIFSYVIRRLTILLEKRRKGHFSLFGKFEEIIHSIHSYFDNISKKKRGLLESIMDEDTQYKYLIYNKKQVFI